MELATLRLFNMFAILPKCVYFVFSCVTEFLDLHPSLSSLLFSSWLLTYPGSELSPPNTELLVQQGGTVVFSSTDTIFRHDDSGILKYTVRALN